MLLLLLSWSGVVGDAEGRRAPARASSRDRAGAAGCGRAAGRDAATSRRRRPSSRTRTRSASIRASSTSCVTSRTAGRCRSQSWVTSPCISMRVRASRALNGSSSSSRSGSLTRARASDTRCACPPERDSGQASRFSVRPTSSSARRARRRARCGPAEFSRASATLLLDPAPGQQPRLLEGDGRAAGDGDLARPARVEAGEAAQQRGLAGAAATEQGDELARRARRGRVRAARDVRAEGAVVLVHAGDDAVRRTGLGWSGRASRSAMPAPSSRGSGRVSR